MDLEKKRELSKYGVACVWFLENGRKQNKMRLKKKKKKKIGN
jgi:hypothetical protein